MQFLKLGRRLVALFAVFMVVLFVILPSLYIFSFVVLRWHELYMEVFAHPLSGNEYWLQIQRYLALSLRLAMTVTLIDILIGIPLAYFIAKGNFPFKGLIEDLTALPLVVPTSGFGFATLMAWTASTSLPYLLGVRLHLDDVIPVFKLPLILLLVHVSLTFPYIVKTVSAALSSLERSYEVVSAALGAKPLTTFRKVTLPLVTPSILSGAVLAFARSLGETGATMIVAGVSTTASIAIVKWEFEGKLAPAAFLGALLVILAFAIILPVEYMVGKAGRGRKVSIPKTLDEHTIDVERRIPRKLSNIVSALSLAFLALIVVLPIATLFYMVAIHWQADPFTGRVEGGVLYQLFGPPGYSTRIIQALTVSFSASMLTTLISLYIAIIIIITLLKSKWARLLRMLLRIPLVIPSSALGLSMMLLWSREGFNLIRPGLWLIVLTHIVFSVPIIVETGLAAYIESNAQVYEDVGRSLGAPPYTVTETISIPLMKRGLLAGSLLAFAHSLGETGATFMVMGDNTTISVLVVNMVEALAIPASLTASAIVVAVSFMLLIVARKLGG